MSPADIRAHDIGSSSLRVSWRALTALEQNGILTLYTVYYQVVGGVMGKKQIPYPQTEAVLTGLEENVQYNIFVTASTKAGEGPRSSSFSVRTALKGKKVCFGF